MIKNQMKDGPKAYSKRTINIAINDIPPSNNKYMGRNERWKYQEDKKYWLMLVRSKIVPSGQPINKAIVRINYVFPTKTRRDPDNYSGKFILDALVRCHVLADDTFDNIELRLSAMYKKGQKWTEIEVKEV